MANHDYTMLSDRDSKAVAELSIFLNAITDVVVRTTQKPLVFSNNIPPIVFNKLVLLFNCSDEIVNSVSTLLKFSLTFCINGKLLD
jgi:hypothetical protein